MISLGSCFSEDNAMQEIRLNTWVSVAEIVSAIAVVISLLYISLQIKHNTASVQANTYKEITSTYGDLQLAIIESEQFAEILVRAETQTSLTPIEEYRLEVWIFFHLGNWEQAFLANDQGILNSDAWLGWDRYYKWLLSKPFFLAVYKNNPVQGYTDRFASHVDLYVQSMEP